MPGVYRLAALVLVCCYAALGSGAVERWHNAQHAAEDARVMAAARAAGVPMDHAPEHDDSNCPFHAQMHLSGLAIAWVPLLICLGFFITFLSMLPERLAPQMRAALATCRGPPALRFTTGS